jgi:hypothetical protein
MLKPIEFKVCCLCGQVTIHHPGWNICRECTIIRVGSRQLVDMWFVLGSVDADGDPAPDARN